MPDPNERHASNICRAALAMVRSVEEHNASAPIHWRARIGVHTGSVVGAVAGTKKYIYDVFGDTIGTASRMESDSEPMKINVPQAAHALVANSFTFGERPALEVKGEGLMRMFFLQA